MFFASEEQCKRVFAFEPVLTTYEFLQKHLELNQNLSKKISAFNYGLGTLDEKQIFSVHKDCDYINTNNTSLLNGYLDTKRKSEMINVEVDLKNVSVIIDTISTSNEISKLDWILKIDIEGAEYSVLENLRKSNNLEKFSVILGECHMGIEGILEIVNEYFDLKFLSKESADGLYNFVLVNRLNN